MPSHTAWCRSQSSLPKEPSPAQTRCSPSPWANISLAAPSLRDPLPSSQISWFHSHKKLVPHLPLEQPPSLPAQATSLPHKHVTLGSSKYPLHCASVGILLPPSLGISVLGVTPASSWLDGGPPRQTQVTHSHARRKTLSREHGPVSTVSSHKHFLHPVFLPLQNCIA